MHEGRARSPLSALLGMRKKRGGSGAMHYTSTAPFPSQARRLEDQPPYPCAILRHNVRRVGCSAAASGYDSPFQALPIR